MIGDQARGERSVRLDGDAVFKRGEAVERQVVFEIRCGANMKRPLHSPFHSLTVCVHSRPSDLVVFSTTLCGRFVSTGGLYAGTLCCCGRYACCGGGPNCAG